VRNALIVATLLLFAPALGQGERQTSLFASVRPDVSIVVREHSSGADLVEITLLNKDYPATLLNSQVASLGRLLGSEPRGLQVFRYQLDPDKPGLTFLKAKFAVDGLVEGPDKLNIEPVLKALCGAPEPFTIRGISLLFADRMADAKTIRNLDDDAVAAEASTSFEPPAVEYRILLKSQDPQAIRFPASAPERKPEAPPSVKQSGAPAWAWAALAVAGLAAGALVYLALLRGRKPSG
jgi:hypothetical protein